MAESTISFIAEKLYNLLIEEVTFLRDVQDQVKWMQRHLMLMQAYVSDAEAKRHGCVMGLWLEQVREVAFDVEDVVDTYILNMHQRQKRQWIARYACIFQKCLITHQTGEQIERVKNILQEIFESRATYGIDFNLGPTPEMLLVDKNVEERRRFAIHRDINYFVGFKEDMDEIIGTLLNEKVEGRCVVSIVGMGGSGKTTLARRICSNEAVKTHFGTSCAFVSVSQTYTLGKILEDIAQEFLEPEQLRGINESQLRQKLCAMLEREKYLIVLDDIWDTQVWSQVQPYLPDTKNGSRVIITTRKMNVAKCADQTHELNLLSDNQSWKLFSKIVFPVDETVGKACPSDLEESCKAILKKCGGLPLAVVVLGGLLSTKPPNVWCNLVEGMNWEEMGPEGSVCLPILGLSYKELPHHLKTCFLYFSCFPEDFVIDAQKLVKLWVAEGFVPDEEKKRGRGKRRTMEETAELWLEDLVQRCLVQVVKMDVSHRVKRCRIHDLLLDLAIKKADEVNFVHTLGRGTQQGSAQVPTTTRRIALHRGSSGDQLPPAPKVRTLLYINTDIRISSLEFVQRLKLIRVLDLEGVKGRCVLPEVIGDLIHLRYLGLRGRWGDGVSNIPSSVGKLQNLQTLDTKKNFQIRKRVPNTVWEMGSLRHVILSYGVKPKVNVGKHLVNLQTLQLVEAGSWIQESLGMMTNLRSLEIINISHSHCRILSRSLDNLLQLRKLMLHGDSLPGKVLALTSHHHLEHLHLRGELLMDGDLEEEQRGVPPVQNYSGIELPPNLTDIKLAHSLLQPDPLLLLGTLSCLRRLDLCNAYNGEEVVCSAGAFPQLERLQIGRMHNLTQWRVEDGAMPHLKFLYIYQCVNLEALPDGLRYLKALHELLIYQMPDQFCGRLEKDGGEDWHKIQHVPIIKRYGQV